MRLRPSPLRHPKLEIVGKAVERRDGKVRLRLDDGTERRLIEAKLEPLDG